MRGARAVLFDIDGTLIDSNELHVDVWLRAFAEVGVTLDRETVHGQIGKGGDILVPTLIPDADAATQERVADRHGKLFKADGLDKARPFPAARELLARVHSDGRAVVLASSAKREELDHYIGLLDAHRLIDAMVSIDDVERSKPAADIFAAALAKIGREAHEAIAVGDTPYDVTSAAKSGIATIGILSGGFSRRTLEQAGAVEVERDVTGLLGNYHLSRIAG